MGGEIMTGNLLLNFVKESNDHGPFNRCEVDCLSLLMQQRVTF